MEGGVRRPHRQAAEENQIEIVYYLLMKKTKIDDYLFVGVYKFEIPQNIEHIRSIPSFSLKTKMALAGLCRSIIVLYGKYSKFMNLIDTKKIPQSGKSHNSTCVDIIKIYLGINEKEFQFIKDDLKKYSLFLTKTISNTKPEIDSM